MGRRADRPGLSGQVWHVLAGVHDPAGVLAIAGSRIFTPRGRPANGRSFVADARLSRGGRMLTVQFYGAPSGTGPCSASYTLNRAFSPMAVAVAVQEHKRDGTALCTAVGYPRRVTVGLPAPLGGRVLVDGASGVAVTVLPAGP